MWKRIRKSRRRLIKTFAEQVAVILQERDAQDRRPVLIMAEDEGRFGRISTMKKAWAPRGCRPIAARQVVRTYLYGYAAVCPAFGKMTASILPFANTDMMTLFLEQVSRDFQEYFVIIMMDKAGWHVSKSLSIPENIRIIRQPSHSPELNPVEHVWDELREKYFNNKAFKTLDAVEHTLCKGFQYLMHNPGKLKSLTNYSFMNITS